MHFPGVPERDKRMRYYLERAERHLPEWELDLASTNHTSEITQFWSEQQIILQKERAKAERAADSANDLIKIIETQLTAYSIQLSETDITNTRSQIQVVRKVLYDSWDDVEAITASIQQLREVVLPRHPFTYP